MFTGRITKAPEFEQKKKKNGEIADFISFTMVCNSDEYNNFARVFLYVYCWGKLASKINAQKLMKGDGVRIDCKYNTKSLMHDTFKYPVSQFELKWLCLTSMAKTIEEDVSEETDADDEVTE
jgi:single-stranded DNA-binding protein